MELYSNAQTLLYRVPVQHFDRWSKGQCAQCTVIDSTVFTEILMISWSAWS